MMEENLAYSNDGLWKLKQLQQSLFDKVKDLENHSKKSNLHRSLDNYMMSMFPEICSHHFPEAQWIRHTYVVERAHHQIHIGISCYFVSMSIIQCVPDSLISCQSRMLSEISENIRQSEQIFSKTRMHSTQRLISQKKIIPFPSSKGSLITFQLISKG